MRGQEVAILGLLGALAGSCATERDYFFHQDAEPDQAAGGTGGDGAGGASGGAGGDTSSGGTGGVGATGGSGGTAGEGGEGGTSGPVCGVDKKACPGDPGTCEALDSPQTGCGNLSSCEPCALPHATSACDAEGQCAIASCESPWEDCDGLSANGCEADPSKTPDHCGGCGKSCPTATQVPFVCVGGTCSCFGNNSCRGDYVKDNRVECLGSATSVGPCRCCNQNDTATCTSTNWSPCAIGEYCRSLDGSTGRQATCTCNGFNDYGCLKSNTKSPTFQCVMGQCACASDDSCRQTGLTLGYGETVQCVDTGPNAGKCVCNGSVCRPGEHCSRSSTNPSEVICTCGSGSNVVCSGKQVCRRTSSDPGPGAWACVNP